MCNSHFISYSDTLSVIAHQMRGVAKSCPGTYTALQAPMDQDTHNFLSHFNTFMQIVAVIYSSCDAVHSYVSNFNRGTTSSVY